jgi:predicted metal-dependent HD superfamily phosphohydrolase
MVTSLTPARWSRLLNAFGISDEAATFDALVAAYSQKHRHYHTVGHIEHCLQEFDSMRELAQEPAEVELALWFHDAVYEPRSSNNEERSADWACELLNRHCVEASRVERVRTHIMATRHEAPATLPDSQLLVDIDLSILGAAEATYAKFESDVRQEYRWVPSLLFRRKRAEILQSFLDRPRLYNTRPMYDRLEAPARRNLAAAIASLRR